MQVYPVQVRRLLSRPNGIRHSIVTRERSESFVSHIAAMNVWPGQTPRPAFAEAKQLLRLVFR
jgi:hypothetical protein